MRTPSFLLPLEKKKKKDEKFKRKGRKEEIGED